TTLGEVLCDLGDLPAAREACEAALAACRKALGDDHPHTARTRGTLALVLHNLGDLPAAHRALLDALATYRKIMPDGHPGTGVLLGTLGLIQYGMGDGPAARQSLEESAAVLSRYLDVAALAQGEQLQLALAAWPPGGTGWNGSWPGGTRPSVPPANGPPRPRSAPPCRRGSASSTSWNTNTTPRPHGRGVATVWKSGWWRSSSGRTTMSFGW